MRLCKKCAFPVGMLTVSCERCAFRFPWFRSAPPRAREIRLPRWLAAGRACPHCAIASRRRRTPLALRPLKGVLGERFSYRTCDRCGWSGPSFHGPVEPAQPVGGEYADAGRVVHEPGMAKRRGREDRSEVAQRFPA